MNEPLLRTESKIQISDVKPDEKKEIEMNQLKKKPAEQEEDEGSEDSNSSLNDSQIDILRRRADESDFTYYMTLQKVTTKLKNSYSHTYFGKIIKALYKKTRVLRIVILWIYVFVTFFQKPTWCNQLDTDGTLLYVDNCQYDKQGNQISLSMTYFLPDHIYYGIKIGAISILWLLRLVKVSIIQENVRLLFTFETVLSIALVMNDLYIRDSLNFSGLLTPLIILLYSNRVQLQLRHFLRIFMKGKEIFFFMVFNQFLYAGIGKVLFTNTTVNPIFGLGMFDILQTMFTLQTTVNSPDVYLAYYGESYWYSIYFISFQFINTTLILNFIIVIFYSTYKQDIQNETQKLMKLHDQKFEELEKKIEKKKKSKTQQMLEMIESGVTQEVQLPKEGIVYNIMSNPFYELPMNLICLHIFYLIFQDLNKEGGVTNLSLNGVILCEELIIYQQIGLEGLWKKKTFLFSLLQTLSIMGLQLISFIFYSSTLTMIMKLLMWHRFFRPSTKLLRSTQFPKMVINVIKLIPYLLDLFGVLFTLFLFFASLGQMLFGGKIHHGLVSMLQQNILSPDYIYLSFNDLFSGFITCWALLIINNWNLIALMFCNVMNNKGYVVYFICYYVIGILIFLNVTVAILIEYLVSKWEQLPQQDQKEKEEAQSKLDTHKQLPEIPEEDETKKKEGNNDQRVSEKKDKEKGRKSDIIIATPQKKDEKDSNEDESKLPESKKSQ